MQQQDPAQQQIQELTNKLVNAQSRSFELISSMTSERDEARANINGLNNILKTITDELGLENPTAESLVEEVARLVKAGATKGKK